MSERDLRFDMGESVKRSTASSGEGGDATGKRPRNRTLPPVTVAVYNEFIDGVELVSIRLAAGEIRAASTPERRRLVPRIEQQSRFTNEEDHVVVTHELTFAGAYDDEAAPAVLIRAELEVRYSSSQRMTNAIFREFRSRNLPLNTWPYFREFVHAALARTGWPVYVLPVYKAARAPLADSDATDDG